MQSLVHSLAQSLVQSLNPCSTVLVLQSCNSQSPCTEAPAEPAQLNKAGSSSINPESYARAPPYTQNSSLNYSATIPQIRTARMDLADDCHGMRGGGGRKNGFASVLDESMSYSTPPSVSTTRVLNSELSDPSNARAAENGAEACTESIASQKPRIAHALNSRSASQAR